MRRLFLLPLLLAPLFMTQPTGHAASATAHPAPRMADVVWDRGGGKGSAHRLDLRPPGIYKAPAPLPRSVRLPASVDLTQWAEPVRDQGQVGSCASFATTQLEYWQYNHDLGLTYADGFAPMNQYSRAAKQNGGDAGSTFPQNYDVEQQYGAVPVHQYEAKPRDADGAHAAEYDWQDLPSASDDSHAAPHKITGYHVLFSTYPNGGGQAGLDAIKAELAAGHPVAIGFTVTENYMYYGTNSGPIQAGGTTVYGRHANGVYGFDSTGLDSLNQWSTSWGHAGWAKLSPGFIRKQVEEAWVIDGVSNPQPSPTNTPGPSPTTAPMQTPAPTATATIPTSPTAVPTNTPEPTATLAPPPPPPTLQPTKQAGRCRQWSPLFDERRVVDGKTRRARWQYCQWYISG